MITLVYADKKTQTVFRHDSDIEDMFEATCDAMYVFSKFMLEGQPVRRLLDFRLIGIGYDAGDEAIHLIGR